MNEWQTMSTYAWLQLHNFRVECVDSPAIPLFYLKRYWVILSLSGFVHSTHIIIIIVIISFFYFRHRLVCLVSRQRPINKRIERMETENYECLLLTQTRYSSLANIYLGILFECEWYFFFVHGIYARWKQSRRKKMLSSSIDCIDIFLFHQQQWRWTKAVCAVCVFRMRGLFLCVYTSAFNIHIRSFIWLNRASHIYSNTLRV